MPPMNGYQDYSQTARAPVDPAQVGQALGGDGDRDDMMPRAAPTMPVAPPGVATEHSPESTQTALAHAVGMALARKPGGPTGRNTLTQLRQLGVPENELTIDRASGLVEGEDE